MKKLLLAFTCALACAAASHVAPAQAEGWYRVVGVAENDVLNVRRGPSPSARKVGWIGPYASGIYIHECRAQWCYVSHGDTDGWVNSRFLVRQ